MPQIVVTVSAGSEATPDEVEAAAQAIEQAVSFAVNAVPFLDSCDVEIIEDADDADDDGE